MLAGSLHDVLQQDMATAGWSCRYCPSEVRRKAAKLLDHAFPSGSRSRAIVRLLFRLMHPGDWPALLWLWLVGIVSGVWGWFQGVFARIWALWLWLWRCVGNPSE